MHKNQQCVMSFSRFERKCLRRAPNLVENRLPEKCSALPLPAFYVWAKQQYIWAKKKYTFERRKNIRLGEEKFIHLGERKIVPGNISY